MNTNGSGRVMLAAPPARSNAAGIQFPATDEATPCAGELPSTTTPSVTLSGVCLSPHADAEHRFEFCRHATHDWPHRGRDVPVSDMAKEEMLAPPSIRCWGFGHGVVYAIELDDTGMENGGDGEGGGAGDGGGGEGGGEGGGGGGGGGGGVAGMHVTPPPIYLFRETFDPKFAQLAVGDAHEDPCAHGFELACRE